MFKTWLKLLCSRFCSSSLLVCGSVITNNRSSDLSLWDTLVHRQDHIPKVGTVKTETLQLPWNNNFKHLIVTISVDVCVCGETFKRNNYWQKGILPQRYQIFWEVVGLERGPLSLVSTTEELLERKRSCSSLETREYGRRDLSSWPHATLYSQKLALTSPTRGGRLVGIVLSCTQAMEFFFSLKGMLWVR
jgi:hypothetical protein